MSYENIDDSLYVSCMQTTILAHKTGFLVQEFLQKWSRFFNGFLRKLLQTTATFEFDYIKISDIANFKQEVSLGLSSPLHWENLAFY